MMDHFQANCLQVLIGSLPLKDHRKAVNLVLQHTPEIPLWVQLPCYKEEGMIEQFLPGMPGLTLDQDKAFINTVDEKFEQDLLKFYEDYMAVVNKDLNPDDSRFSLKEDTAKGFFVFLESLRTLSGPPVAVKGQITGPITFCTGVSDQNGKAIYYNEQLKDAAVKLIALKAGWQVQKLSVFGSPVIVFFDEPALAGFGSSAFISISRDEVTKCFEEVIETVHAEGGLAGIHVCANADWSIILESSVDIVSFDAYSFFDRFILYSDPIKKFIKSGRTLAWGIVPTSRSEDIERAEVESLVLSLEKKIGQIAALDLDQSAILSQSLITPSCGTGSLSLDNAIKVLRLTREISDSLRRKV
jgi:methionine synthase II (cobalamin-independent)